MASTSNVILTYLLQHLTKQGEIGHLGERDLFDLGLSQLLIDDGLEYGLINLSSKPPGYFRTFSANNVTRSS